MSDTIGRAFADLRAGRLKMQCAICGVEQGGCDCWTKCQTAGCSWSYRKEEFCRNCAKKLTPRQIDHLENMSRPARGKFSVSVYMALGRYGFARCIPSRPLQWKITPAGEALLKDLYPGNQ